MTEFHPVDPLTRAELKHDQNRNVWIFFPNEPPVTSIISGNETSRAVLTPAGLRILQQTRKKSSRWYIDTDPFRVGDEGDLRRITTLTPTSSQELVEDLTAVKAVEKRLKSTHGASLLGWEVLKLFVHLKPIFDEHKFHLLNPYGGTNRALYLPFIGGITVKNLMAQNMTDEQAVRISSFLRAHTLPLHHDVYKSLSEYLITMGFHLAREGDQLLGQHTVFTNRERVVRVTVDLHPTKFSDDDRYRNWMLTANARQECLTMLSKGKIEEISSYIRSNMVAIDPFFIRGPDKYFQLT